MKHAGARLLYFPSATTEYLRWLIWVIQMPWALFPCCPYPFPSSWPLNQGQHPAPSSQEASPQPDTPFPLPLQSCTRSHSQKNPLNYVREARQKFKAVSCAQAETCAHSWLTKLIEILLCRPRFLEQLTLQKRRVTISKKCHVVRERAGVHINVRMRRKVKSSQVHKFPFSECSALLWKSPQNFQAWVFCFVFFFWGGGALYMITLQNPLFV